MIIIAFKISEMMDGLWFWVYPWCKLPGSFPLLLGQWGAINSEPLSTVSPPSFRAWAHWTATAERTQREYFLLWRYISNFLFSFYRPTSPRTIFYIVLIFHDSYSAHYLHPKSFSSLNFLSSNHWHKKRIDSSGWSSFCTPKRFQKMLIRKQRWNGTIYT